MTKLRGTWFGDPHDAQEFAAVAANHGRNYAIKARDNYELFIPGRVTQILNKSDFIVMPLSLPELSSLWFVERANQAGSEARLILRSSTDADPAALCQLFDGMFRPEDGIVPVLDMIDARSARVRDSQETGQLIERVLQTSFHFKALNHGTPPTLAQVRARPRLRQVSSAPPAITLTAEAPAGYAKLASKIVAFNDQATRAPWAFFSYSSANVDVVESLHTRLHREGIVCWFDREQIDPGHSILGEIARGLRTSGVFVAFLSKASITSPWVLRELNFARAFKHNAGLKYLPILLEDLPDLGEIPEMLRGIRFLDLRQGTDEQQHEAVKAIQGLLRRPPNDP